VDLCLPRRQRSPSLDPRTDPLWRNSGLSQRQRSLLPPPSTGCWPTPPRSSSRLRHGRDRARLSESELESQVYPATPGAELAHPPPPESPKGPSGAWWSARTAESGSGRMRKGQTAPSSTSQARCRTLRNSRRSRRTPAISSPHRSESRGSPELPALPAACRTGTENRPAPQPDPGSRTSLGGSVGRRRRSHR